MRSESVSGRARRTARRMATIPYPAPSAPSLALCVRMVQSKAQSLPCLSCPSLSLLRLSGLRSPPKCPTSFALPMPSSLVLASPRCMTLRRTLHLWGRAALWQYAMAPRLVQCPHALRAARSVVGHLFAPVPLSLFHAAVARPLLFPAISDPLPSGQREHDAEQFARQRSLSASPLCPGPLALSRPLSARPPSPCPAPRPWLQGLWPPVSLSPSSLYPLGVYRAEQCARQPSQSLSSLLPPGVLSSWQVARTMYRTRYLRGQAV